MVLILDTNSGVDEMLALLLLLSASRKQELCTITFSYGNNLQKHTLSNFLSLFYVLKRVNEWRYASYLPLFSEHRPLVCLGASKALNGEAMSEVGNKTLLLGRKTVLMLLMYTAQMD